jgi:type VI protein secretion system component VasK
MDKRPGGSKRKWRDMSSLQRTVAIVMAVAQFSLAGAEVRGPKWRWALTIGLNFFGPIAYLCRGRIRSPGAQVG